MAHKAVFLDRDHTLMEDPGYLADPDAVRLLPGVELAIKSLSQAGYKIVVVTNQSGVARGLLTEETLAKIHAELRRQLGEKGAQLDGIYYCPYHPEGTVPAYAIDSDLRKPQPGMLLKAAEELDIDLSASWMIGDSPADIEAGQRAGCRTIRVRTAAPPTGQQADEDAQADANVRNLVDAARVILREPVAAPVVTTASNAVAGGTAPPDVAAMSDSEIRREILRHLQQLVRSHHEEEFSLAKLIGSIVQVLVLLTLLIGFVKMIGDEIQHAIVWMLIALVLQVMTLTAFSAQRRR